MIWFADHFWLLLVPMLLGYLAIGVVIAKVGDMIFMWLHSGEPNHEMRAPLARSILAFWPAAIPTGLIWGLFSLVGKIISKLLGDALKEDEEMTPKPHPHPLRPQYVIRPPVSPTRRLDLKEMRK